MTASKVGNAADRQMHPSQALRHLPDGEFPIWQHVLKELDHMVLHYDGDAAHGDGLDHADAPAMAVRCKAEYGILELLPILGLGLRGVDAPHARVQIPLLNMPHQFLQPRCSKHETVEAGTNGLELCWDTTQA